MVIEVLSVPWDIHGRTDGGAFRLLHAILI